MAYSRDSSGIEGRSVSAGDSSRPLTSEGDQPIQFPLQYVTPPRPHGPEGNHNPLMYPRNLVELFATPPRTSNTVRCNVTDVSSTSLEVPDPDQNPISHPSSDERHQERLVATGPTYYQSPYLSPQDVRNQAELHCTSPIVSRNIQYRGYFSARSNRPRHSSIPTEAPRNRTNTSLESLDLQSVARSCNLPPVQNMFFQPLLHAQNVSTFPVQNCSVAIPGPAYTFPTNLPQSQTRFSQSLPQHGQRDVFGYPPIQTPKIQQLLPQEGEVMLYAKPSIQAVSVSHTLPQNDPRKLYSHSSLQATNFPQLLQPLDEMPTYFDPSLQVGNCSQILRELSNAVVLEEPSMYKSNIDASTTPEDQARAYRQHHNFHAFGPPNKSNESPIWGPAMQDIPMLFHSNVSLHSCALNNIQQALTVNSNNGSNNMAAMIASKPTTTTSPVAANLRPPLSRAAERQFNLLIKRNLPKEIQEFLKRTELSDVNYSFKNQQPPLLRAVRAMAYDVVKLLLDLGADPRLGTANTKLGPLQLAAKTGQVKMLQLLLQDQYLGMEPDHRPSDNQDTALVYAVEKCHVQAAKLLLSKGSDVTKTKPMNTGVSAIQLAAKSNSVILLKMVLERLDHGSWNDLDMLHRVVIAAVEGDATRCLKYLVRQIPNLDLDFEMELFGITVTPLFRAADSGFLDSTMFLLKHGVNVNRPCDNSTPLITATTKRNLLSVSCLLQNGALPSKLRENDEVGRNWGLLDLMRGCPFAMNSNWPKNSPPIQPPKTNRRAHRYKQHDQMIKEKFWVPRSPSEITLPISVKKKRKRNKMVQNRTPQPNIVQSNTEFEFLEVLAQYGCNFDHHYSRGTALHYAVEYGCRAVITALLYLGANPLERNTDGLNALQLAIHCNAIAAVRELVISCPLLFTKPYIGEDESMFPMRYAIERNRPKCLEVLINAGYIASASELIMLDNLRALDPLNIGNNSLSKLVNCAATYHLLNSRSHVEVTLLELALRQSRISLGYNLRLQVNYLVATGFVPGVLGSMLLLRRRPVQRRVVML